MLHVVHHRVTPSIKFAGTHLYTWVERDTIRVKCLAQEHNAVPRQGLESRPPDPESSALTIRPPRLPIVKINSPNEVLGHGRVHVSNLPTVESRFVEPPGEMKIGSRNWELQETKGLINQHSTVCISGLRALGKRKQQVHDLQCFNYNVCNYS